MIIMAYYALGSIEKVAISEDEYVTALGQVLDGLRHLHAQGVVHRDLKPENLLVERKPVFKVVITDFGLAKVVNKPTLLKTFCGSPMYAAPEVFPGITNGHGPEADVWSLGVIGLGWFYGLPKTPEVPVSSNRLRRWIRDWCNLLRDKLEDEEPDQMIEILDHMVYVDVSERWSALECLRHGFNNYLFKRRVADGLVVCINEPDNLQFFGEEGSGATKSPSTRSASPQSSGFDVTIIVGNRRDSEVCSI